MAKADHEKLNAKRRAQRFLTPSGKALRNESEDRAAEMRAYHAQISRMAAAGFNSLPSEKQRKIEDRNLRRMQLAAHKSHHKNDRVSLAPLKFLEKPMVD